MTSPPISCPVVKVPDVVPCAPDELDALVAFLQSDASVEETRAFARGTVLPDGRLDLCKQSVGAVGCARITAALHSNSHIKSVLLGTDSIGDEGAFAVARLVEENPHLEVVYLGCNGITEPGAGELARVMTINESVKGLWFKRNPIGDGGMRALAQMLRTNTHLQILDVVNCGFNASAFVELCTALRDDNRTLKRLYAGGNGQLPAASVAEVLTHSPSLEGLFLNVGTLGDEGAEQLAQGLKGNLTLRELGVGSNGIERAGLKALCWSLATHPTIEGFDAGRAASQTVLGAQSNDFAGGGEVFAEMLRGNRTLRRLNLRGTKLGNRDFETIFDATVEHPALCELQVDTPIRQDVKEALGTNRARSPLAGNLGVELIRSVYRTVKEKSAV